MDPVIKYHESPYVAFANNPIWLIDPNGADTIGPIKCEKHSTDLSTIDIEKGSKYSIVVIGTQSFQTNFDNNLSFEA